MGELRISCRLDVSGPLADGTADRALAEWEQNTSRALADEAVAMLGHFPMDRTGRATGAFREHLRPVRKTRAVMTVPGPMIEGVTWAPWLEGTSRRNRSTGFRGYRLFRKTRRSLRERAADIGQAELDKIMPRLGGE